MSERLVLDPAEVALAGRPEIDLTADDAPVRVVGPGGPQFSEAGADHMMADGGWGALPVDQTFPNRTVEIPLVALSTDRETLNQARARIQQWAARVQLEGGWFLREFADGSKLYHDAVRATLRWGASSSSAFGFADADGVLVIEYLPDPYGPELQVGSGSGRGAVTVTCRDVPGDLPARCRIVIEDRSGVDQRGLVYAVRPANPDPAAAMDFAAADLTPLSGATATGGRVDVSSPPPIWMSVLSTEIDGVGPMTHVGAHRVLLLLNRVGAQPEDLPLQLRLEWSHGGQVAPTLNEIRSWNGGAGWVDLGEVRVPRATAGPQRWQGRVLMHEPNQRTVALHRLLVLPTDHAYGTVGASNVTPSVGAAITAWDSFNHTPGTLDGNTAPAGGRWAGAGATGEFMCNGEFAWRDTARESNGLFSGRFAVLDGVDADSTDVGVTLSIPYFFQAGQIMVGQLARYKDARNWVGGFRLATYGSPVWVMIAKCVSGVVSILATGFESVQYGAADCRLQVSPSGEVVFTSNDVTVASADSDLASAGALARGTIGLYDTSTLPSPTSIGRRFDNLFMMSPGRTIADAVTYASKSAELATGGFQREDPAGAFGRLVVAPDLPRVPAGGDADVYVRVSRAPWGTPLSSGSEDDDIDVTVNVQPCRLFVPGD